MPSVRSLYQKILGHPFVYEQIRPRVVGGIDMRGLYEMLGPEGSKVVLDVGCGTGDALNYLDGFEEYFGVDNDSVAIDAARLEKVTVLPLKTPVVASKPAGFKFSAYSSRLRMPSPSESPSGPPVTPLVTAHEAKSPVGGAMV